MVVLIILLLLIIVLNWYQIKNRRHNYLLSKIPGPKKLPILHNGLDLVGKSGIEILKWAREQERKFGSVYQLTTSLFDTGIVLVSDTKIIEALLTSKVLLDKTDEYNFMVPWIGDGLVTSTGQKYLKRRKLVSQALHFKMMDHYISIMNKQAKIFVQQLSKYEGKMVNICPFVDLLTLDILSETTIGVKVNAQTTSSDYVTAINELCQIISVRTFDITKQNSILFRFSKMYERHQKCLKILNGFADDIIRKRRNELLTKSSKEEEKSLVDILLCSSIDGKPLDDIDIRDEVNTFLFAGTDTTNSVISFLLYNIAKYPDVQEKVYEEVMQVLGDDDEITARKLNDLVYLGLVIKESLRLFPPIPFFGRKLSQDLTVNGYCFPKGIKIYACPVLLSNNPNIFPEPEKFDPHRFDSNLEKSNPFGFIPFSAGPRSCIGQKFAHYELCTVISNVVRNFKLILAEGQEELKLKYDLLLKPVEGIFIYFERRKQVDNWILNS